MNTSKTILRRAEGGDLKPESQNLLHSGFRFHPSSLFLAMFAAAVCFLGGVAWAGEILDAVKAGDIRKVAMLLDANPQLINAGENSHRETLLHFAVRKEQAEIVKLLLARKADANAKNDNGGSPLNWP